MYVPGFWGASLLETQMVIKYADFTPVYRKPGTYGILSHSLETMSWILRVAANDSDIYIIKVCPAKADPLPNYTYPGNSGLSQCLGSHADIKLMSLKVTLHTN